jgi:hypothetical protein
MIAVRLIRAMLRQVHSSDMFVLPEMIDLKAPAGLAPRRGFKRSSGEQSSSAAGSGSNNF